MTAETRKTFPDTKPKVSFPELEEKVLAFWQQDRTFHKSMEMRARAGAPDYVFYDGPPFATGLPHYGHILTSYIKDTVPRFFTMRGFHVDRRWGWDCHGLPIENEIERDLGINSRREIEAIGIDTFNARCRDVVTRYTKEWEEIITRLGRWVDFQRDYKTMDRDYMESVLHVFWQLHQKGLIYEGDKVVPYCYRCQTPLSNFEARLDDSFRPRQDPSITVMFRLSDSKLDAPEHVLAWTTTPWTLPSNVGLAVGADIDYVLLRDPDGYFWIAKARLEAYRKQLAKAEVVREAKGGELAGRRYEPLFPYFAHLEGGFRVLAGDFVTTEDGTGVVHVAPAFGEEDYELGVREGLPRPNPVDGEGRFTAEVTDFAGQNVHDANREVIRWLKERGKLVHQQTIDHNYPHCWRDDTPLIYKTVPTWYVNVLAFKDRMLAANRKINWVPDHIGEGRFGDWLSNARDWAISRNRFWGAPIPVWKCDKTGEIFVPESVAELEQLCGRTIPDLHRPAIDEVTFPSPAGGTFRRVPEVLDCWFESGSMPFAQVHYPFENKEWFEKNFPAQFVVEYIAQTRGWFYTLVVLAAGLKDCPPFLNCICHGVVLAEDGRKMSKRLKNYPDPMDVVSRYGSDSLRSSLLRSPVVRGGNLRFNERDVEQAMRDFLIPFWNAYHFLTAYANIDGWAPGEYTGEAPAPYNRTDRFILAKLEELKAGVEKSMEAYDIVAGYEALVEFIDQLNNWFIRLSRRRFWTDENPESKRAAYEVLYLVLRELALVSAPFTPFLAETIYQGLAGEKESVHLQDWPRRRPECRDEALVCEVGTVQRVIYMGRQLRERHNIKTRQPLRSVQIAGLDPALLRAYDDEIRIELNVKEVVLLEKPEEIVKPHYKLNAKVLGPKHGKDFGAILAAAREGNAEPRDDGRLRVAGHLLEPDEFSIEYQSMGDQLDCQAAGKLIVILSLEIDPELLTEGIARDIIREIQVCRKEFGLDYTDRIRVAIASDNEDIRDAVARHSDWIRSEVLATELEFRGAGVKDVKDPGNHLKSVDVQDADVEILIARA